LSEISLKSYASGRSGRAERSELNVSLISGVDSAASASYNTAANISKQSSKVEVRLTEVIYFNATRNIG
jgi:hypothetical protein